MDEAGTFVIIIWLVAAVSAIALFVIALPHGWAVALLGASLGSSALAALAGVGLAFLRSRPGRVRPAPERLADEARSRSMSDRVGS